MATNHIKKVVISAKKNIIEVLWEDDHTSRFHSCWLRFNCRCDRCRKKVVGELNLKRSDFPDQLDIEKTKLNDSKDDLHLWINGDVLEDHVTLMTSDWLREMCYCDQCLCRMLQEKEMKFNDPSIIPRVDYRKMENDKVLFRMLQDVFNVGFVVISNVPCKEGTVVEIGEKLAPTIGNTYGKCNNAVVIAYSLANNSYRPIFDVFDSTKVSENVANSTIGLPLHTDQCHYEAGPGIQMLHAIQFDDCVEGGDSQLVDMFQVMEILRKESPEDFRVLTRVPCTFSTIDYSRGSPAHLITRKPVIQVDYDDQIVGFAWNPGIEDILRVHENDVEPFFRAYKKIQRISERKELMFQFRLHAGDLLFFNNRRMMHARAAYRSNGGHRRLQGCYINFEELRSKYVVLGRKLGEHVIAPKIGNRSAI